jgi:hypothetical protein
VANVLSRTTGAYLASVNTPDYPETDWIINPDLSAVAGVAPCYWLVEGDSVREMTVEEKAAYDAAHVVIPTNKLSDGTPSFVYQDIVVSVNVTTLVFAVKAANVRKFDIPFVTTGSTFSVERNRLIMSVAVSSAGADNYDLVAKINGVESTRFNVTAEVRKFTNLAIQLAEGEELSFSIESTSDISNPVILVDTAARN